MHTTVASRAVQKRNDLPDYSDNLRATAGAKIGGLNNGLLRRLQTSTENASLDKRSMSRNSKRYMN